MVAQQEASGVMGQVSFFLFLYCAPPTLWGLNPTLCTDQKEKILSRLGEVSEQLLFATLES